ncbi:hypothetical protein ACWD0C_32500, partial [Streptomyces badius]
GATSGTVEIVAPDGQAGVLIDNRLYRHDDEAAGVVCGAVARGTAGPPVPVRVEGAVGGLLAAVGG